MKCPNCGFNFSEGCRCPDCGVDVYVFRKARNASIRLYNEALTLAEKLISPVQRQIWNRAFFLIKITYRREIFSV